MKATVNLYFDARNAKPGERYIKWAVTYNRVTKVNAGVSIAQKRIQFQICGAAMIFLGLCFSSYCCNKCGVNFQVFVEERFVADNDPEKKDVLTRGFYAAMNVQNFRVEAISPSSY